jgi:hypothetical protein
VLLPATELVCVGSTHANLPVSVIAMYAIVLSLKSRSSRNGSLPEPGSALTRKAMLILPVGPSTRASIASPLSNLIDE